MKTKSVTVDSIPESYRPGIKHVEGLTSKEMCEWIENELRENIHMLSGGADDFPVQAIINHYYHLSLKSQKGVDEALDALVFKWKHECEKWPEPAVRALLSLCAELRVANAKNKLQLFANSKTFSKIEGGLRTAVFGAIATLSVNDDRDFWMETVRTQPKFTGMAFQILTRIAPDSALQLLDRLPDDESVIGGIARRLPGFVSEQPAGEKQQVVLARIAKSISSLSSNSAMALRASLTEAGFGIAMRR